MIGGLSEDADNHVKICFIDLSESVVGTSITHFMNKNVLQNK